MDEEGVEPDSEVLVFRLVTEEERFIPEGAPYPNGEVFVPSSGDEREAEERRCPIRVSVWDLGRTSVAQARTFRAVPKPCRAWVLPVRDVRELAEATPRPALRCVRDPLVDGRPGTSGHCGLEGLDRRPGESKLVLKALRQQLAERLKELSAAAEET